LADETLLHTVEVAVAIIALRPEPDSEHYQPLRRGDRRVLLARRCSKIACRLVGTKARPRLAKLWVASALAGVEW
jgi:hypothetical protein